LEVLISLKTQKIGELGHGECGQEKFLKGITYLSIGGKKTKKTGHPKVKQASVGYSPTASFEGMGNRRRGWKKYRETRARELGNYFGHR